MKYCEECKINVNGGLIHCPLCGAHLEKAGVGYERYALEIEACVRYPKLRVARESVNNFLRKRSLFLSLLIAVFAVVLNVWLTPDSLWSAYVATALVLLYVCLFRTLFRNSRFYSLIGVCSFFIPAAMYAADIIHSLDTAGDLTAFGVSLGYAVPAFLILVLILTDVMALTDRSDYKYYLLTMWTVSLASLIPQAIMWIFRVPARYGIYDYVTLALFLFAILNTTVMTVLYWKKLKKELVRKFFV